MLTSKNRGKGGMAVVEQRRSDGEEIATSELDEPIWAVVSFERIEATDLGYHEAEQLMSELDVRGVRGLCIVTNEAASRIKTQG
jgi:hypothetical protein